MSTTATLPIPDFRMIGPDGKSLTMTKELFLAMSSFMKSAERPSGSVNIQFRDGGIIGIEAVIKKTYK